MEPRLTELVVAGEPTDTIEVVVVVRGGRPLPIPAVARFGQVATCRVRRDQVAALSEYPDIHYLSAGQRVAPALFEICASGAHCSARVSAPARGAGSGVVMAFLDWGVDFTHRAFRDRSGRTRLRAIWDQRGGLANNRYGYGTVYSRAQIDQALLDDQPFASLGYVPQNDGRPAHGTHVMDVAAGSSGAGLGLAPAAELVFVHLASSSSGPDGDLGDSVRIIEALDFAVRAAGDRPLVINMSLGSTGGSHTGQSPVELAVDHLLEASPGRAVVQSAGNYRQWRTHAEGRLASGQSDELTWCVEVDDTTANELEIWFSSADEIAVTLISPSGQSFRASPGQRRVLEIDGERVGRLHHDVPERLTGDQRVIAYLLPNAEPGRWRVELRAGRVADGTFHAWIERDSQREHAQSRFSRHDAVDTSTVGTIATSKNGVAVGAIDARDLDTPLARFSSIGPSRDGRVKPDLLAPGVAVLAARSAERGTREGSEEVVAMSGTSMASPHVAGCVAAMFSAALPHRLSISETRRLLLSSARAHPALEAGHVGHGRLDSEAALSAVAERFSTRRNQMSKATELHTRLNPIAGELFETIAASPDCRRFEVIGGPGQVLGDSLAPDDLVVSVAPGESVPAALFRVTEPVTDERGIHAMLESLDGQTHRSTITDFDGRLSPFQAVIRPEDLAAPEYLPGLGPWSDLMSFVPPAAVQAALQRRGARVLRVDEGWGPINLDYYPVRVDRLPRSASTPEQLLQQVRLNINGLVNASIAQFNPATPADASTWTSSNPVGAVLSIDMADDGSVVCSQASSRHWRFSTVFTWGDLNHPVSGNREWGFVDGDGGGWTFYTRGADRLTRAITLPFQSMAFDAAHRLWLSLQRGIVELVNRSGGRARVMTATSRRYDWAEVVASGYYRARPQSAPRHAELDEQAPEDIPLAPGRGGRSIDPGILEIADIIVSTTAHPLSGAIRAVTGGPVSHAMIYVGDGLVVEAIPSGVTLRPIAAALADARLAVAARDERLTTEQALRVRDYAGQQIGRRFDFAGLVVPGSFRLYRRVFGERAGRSVRVDLGRGSDDSFFCSELVLAAFAAAGAPLSAMAPRQAAPYDIAQLILTRRLSYLGHLRA